MRECWDWSWTPVFKPVFHLSFLSSWHLSSVPLNPAVALLNFAKLKFKFKIFSSFLKEIFLCMISSDPFGLAGMFAFS